MLVRADAYAGLCYCEAFTKHEQKGFERSLNGVFLINKHLRWVAVFGNSQLSTGSLRSSLGKTQLRIGNSK